MVIEYTRYKVEETRRQAFIDAHRRATRHLHYRCIRYELSRRSDEREWFTFRVEWPSSEELQRFQKDVAGEAFRNAINGFAGDIQEHWHWEVTDVVHQTSASELGSCGGLGELPDRPPWNRLSLWVLEHLHQKILVEEMAEQVHMSPRNFARVFRRKFGVPPGDFLDRVRVAAAIKDLEEDQQTIEQIAYRRGFGSSSTMRRAFLRVLGIAPSQYRARSHVDGNGRQFGVMARVPSPVVPIPVHKSPLVPPPSSAGLGPALF